MCEVSGIILKWMFAFHSSVSWEIMMLVKIMLWFYSLTYSTWSRKHLRIRGCQISKLLKVNNMLFPDALRTFKKHQSEERLKPFTIDTQISHRFLCLKSPFLRFFFISLPPLPLRKQKLQLLYFRFSFLGYSAVQYLCWKGSIRFRFRYRRYSTKDICCIWFMVTARRKYRQSLSQPATSKKPFVRRA